jgi:RNA polymerase primary sigma factor
LSATLPLDQLSSEEIEDTMTMLSELGITVTESDESEEPVAPEGEPAKARDNLDHDDIGRASRSSPRSRTNCAPSCITACP